jgi:hypothetical protein
MSNDNLEQRTDNILKLIRNGNILSNVIKIALDEHSISEVRDSLIVGFLFRYFQIVNKNPRMANEYFKIAKNLSNGKEIMYGPIIIPK